MDNIDVSNYDVSIIGKMDENANNWNPGMKLFLIATNHEALSLINEYIKQVQSIGWKIQIVNSLEEARERIKELLPCPNKI